MNYSYLFKNLMLYYDAFLMEIKISITVFYYTIFDYPVILGYSGFSQFKISFLFCCVAQFFMIHFLEN